MDSGVLGLLEIKVEYELLNLPGQSFVYYYYGLLLKEDIMRWTH